MTYLNKGRVSRCRKCQQWLANAWPTKTVHDLDHAWQRAAAAVTPEVIQTERQRRR